MLSQKYDLDALRSLLLPRAGWRPYPTADEREPWEAMGASIRQALVAAGEDALGFEWPPLPATRFLDYARVGDRERYQDLSFGRRKALGDLVLAECCEGGDRFLDDIANGVWAICEESFWGVPAHIGVQKAGSGLPDTAEPIVDLFAAETSALLAWTCYLLAPQLDAVSPLIVPRVQREMDYRMLTPLLDRDDFGWMGFRGGGRPNNWNPWINSNWLTAALLMEPDEERRLAAVAKSMRSLDCFLDPHPRDGGCDEGPGYWGRAGASVFDCLEVLRSASGGEIDSYDEPLIREMGRFIYRVQIHENYFVNFADASALAAPLASVVYGYGKRIGDADMQALGAWLAGEGGVPKRDSLGRRLSALFDFADLTECEPRQPLPRDVWLPDIEVMVARDTAGSSAGLFLAAKGGHNAESHNHNDVGSFVVFADGKPVLIDAGVETYTRKTFSSDRYDLWTMQSAYHTLLPTVDGVQQHPGGQFAASAVSYESTDGSATLTLDLAGAYPPEAKLKSWVRTISLIRGKGLNVRDEYELSKAVGEVSLSFLTPCDVEVVLGSVMLRGRQMTDDRGTGSARIEYDGKAVASVERLALDDAKLRGVWGEYLSRVVFLLQQPETVGELTFRITQS